jgi:hypothetical protein
MTTQELFPHTYEHLNQTSPELALAFGSSELDWNRDDSTERLRNALISVQHLCDGDFDRLTSVTVQMLLDILALRLITAPDVKPILNFLQIDISISVMGTAYGQKRLQSIFDWAIYSISDNYPFERENQFETSRLQDLFTRSRPSLYSTLGRENGLEWIKFFYYYVFKVGGLKELARLLAPFVINLLIHLLPAKEAVEPAVRVAEWSVRDSYPDRRRLLESLKLAFDSSEPGSKSNFILGLAFALLLGNECRMDTNALAQNFLQTYASCIPPNSELQLLQASLIPHPAKIMQNLSVIVNTVERYRKQTLSIPMEEILIEYEFERSFTLINAIVFSLLQVGESNAASVVIAAWKGINGSSARQDVLFILPNESSGVLYSRQGAVFRIETSTLGNKYTELIDAINHFHGINIVLDDDDSLTPHIATRPGLPDNPVESSRKYLSAMREQFRFLQATEFFIGAEQGAVGAIQLIPGLPCPLQPLMIKDIGFSWPFASTMNSPHSDRECRHALIWTGNTFLGTQQAKWITEVLQPQILVTHATGDETRFKTEFSNPEYDAIWVTTHGEFDHMDPHRSRLVINEYTEMTFSDLRNIDVPGPGRRLLVLDACDSGAAPVYGGMSNLGFGPLLASASQAVICYRWPVEQFASAIFNVLLAIGLRTTSFYQAYEFAIATIIQGKERTVAKLSDVLGQDHDLVSRIQDNHSIRWDTLVFWASATFLE